MLSMQLQKLFLAGDDAMFLARLRSLLGATYTVISWPSALSESGKDPHYDSQLPGQEAAADAFADVFCLSRCKGLISTFSCLSVLAALWSQSDDYECLHFRHPQVDAEAQLTAHR